MNSGFPRVFSSHVHAWPRATANILEVRPMMRFAVPLLLAFGPAAPALAQTFEPPEGCTGFLTVQQRGCMVSNHYTCEEDPEGDQWRVDFIPEGAVFASRINEETEWVESLGLITQERSTLDSAEDPASLSDLLESGIDTYEFTTVTDEGDETRWTGADQLTGETVTIDGHELKKLDYTTVSDGPEGTSRQKGTNFVSEEFGLFLPGVSAEVQEDGSLGPEENHTPVRIIEPGEEGFFSSQPIYDCGAQDISWEAQ